MQKQRIYAEIESLAYLCKKAELRKHLVSSESELIGLNKSISEMLLKIKEKIEALENGI